MNYLGINCSVDKGFGKVIVVILNSDNEVMRYVFKSPSVFSFKENSAEILNWHRDNIISLISQYNIEGISIKKTESSPYARLKNSDIFKLYLEGVLLSLAGSIGKPNRHFYKSNIKAILNDPVIFDLDIDTICANFNVVNCFDDIPNVEVESTKDTLLAVLSLKRKIVI